jgi:thiol:disulfide interchange protein DsbA
MYRVSIKSFLIIYLSLFSFALNAKDYRPGIDYQFLDEEVQTRNPEKIEVIEFFWLGCGHCFTLEGLIRDWKKNINKDIDFWRVPVTWNPPAKEHAKLFYAAEALGMEEIIGSAFTSIHLDRKFLTSEREITELFSAFGVEPDKYQAISNSFRIKSNINAADVYGRKYEIMGVPAFIVNGKYKVKASRDIPTEELLDVVDHLVDIERSQ